MFILKSIVEQKFYDREVCDVAHDLIGRRLVRKWNGSVLAGIIIEAEAYRGEEDLACHAHVGKTRRNATMYGPPGHAYIYFTYGMHWMLNCVCGPDGFPAAVLLRSILPTDGLQIIASRRHQRGTSEWCNGPAKICQALGLDGKLNSTPLFHQAGELRIEEGIQIPSSIIQTSPRIGLGSTPEPWLSKPWRYFITTEQLQNPG
jgi:DNA-3-methyladenine glycosylase